MGAKQKSKANRPAPPEDLDGEALLEWHRVCDDLDAAGKLATTDRALIHLYAQTWQTWCVAQRFVNRTGPVIKFPNGAVGQNPFYKTANETLARLTALLKEMGLTPSARGAAFNSDDAGDLDI